MNDPFKLTEEDPVWITMPDGARLSATLWRPVTDMAVPAILEIIPYRRSDVTWARDRGIHPHLAAAGFASVRVDMRGSGDSDGLLSDSVKTTANSDTEEVIAWLADQPWCDGQVGMIGISWGGANVIFTAARRPPALKAAVACCFSHDTYQFGMFYRGGCVLTRIFAWSTMVSAMNARPPDPKAVGRGWKAQWRARLDDLTPQIEGFLGHQNRGDYWDNRLIRDWDKLDIPLALYWGQQDPAFANAAADLLPRLSGAKQATLTPSIHRYPHDALPGPSIDVVPEWTRFFAAAFSGRPPLDGPPLRAFRREDQRPDPIPDGDATGAWIGVDTFAEPDMILPAGDLEVAGGIDMGLESGEIMPWCAFAPGPELPGDQTPADARSVVVEWPVNVDLDLLGRPTLTAHVSADRPVAQLAARLMDISPDGRATRIGFGVVSLNRVASDRNPRPLDPGTPLAVTLPLDVLCYRVKAGHTLRLALGTGAWPLVGVAP